MFGRATITLGIGPHSSIYIVYHILLSLMSNFHFHFIMAALCNRTGHTPKFAIL